MFLNSFVTLPPRTLFSYYFVCIKHYCSIFCCVFACLADVSHMASLVVWENYMGDGKVRILAQKHAFHKLKADHTTYLPYFLILYRLISKIQLYHFSCMTRLLFLAFPVPLFFYHYTQIPNLIVCFILYCVSFYMGWIKYIPVPLLEISFAELRSLAPVLQAGKRAGMTYFLSSSTASSSSLLNLIFHCDCLSFSKISILWAGYEKVLCFRGFFMILLIL